MRGNSTPFYKIEYNVDHHREAPTQIDMYLSNPTCDRSAATSRGTLEMLSWIGWSKHAFYVFFTNQENTSAAIKIIWNPLCSALSVQSSQD